MKNFDEIIERVFWERIPGRDIACREYDCGYHFDELTNDELADLYDMADDYEALYMGRGYHNQSISDEIIKRTGVNDLDEAADFLRGMGTVKGEQR